MKYSQGNQDAILQSIFRDIGTTNKFCVEFGFNSDSLTGGSGSNTARLILADGWKGLLLDCDHENPAINLHREHLSYENIGLIFEKYNVPTEPDYVSIDVDGDDLWLFKGILEACFRPRVVSVEYNARFPIDVSVTMKRNAPKWENDAAYGASMLALITVALEYGYGLVAVDIGLDLFFVRGAQSIQNVEDYCNIHVHPVPSQERQTLFINYPSLEPVTEHPWWSG